MIFIVIPVHNRINQTLKCLESIEAQDYSEITIIVVNDGSTDNTQKLIRQNHSQVITLNGTGKLFWTGAIAYGIDHALKYCKEKDWILLLNNDVTLENNTIKNLISLAKANDRKLLLNAVSLDGRDKDTIVKSGTIMRSWFFNLSKHVLNGESYSNADKEEIIEVDLLTGRCLLHPVEIFSQVGNYDFLNFQHYGGDDEFSSRAKRFGYTLGVAMNSKVYLDTSTTGIKGNFFKNGPQFLLNNLFSIRSSNNIITKLKFTWHVVPTHAMPTYFLIAVLKSLFLTFK